MSLDLTAALILSCAILLLVSNMFPIAMLEVQGVRNETTLLGAVFVLFHEDRPLVAVLVLMTTIVLPALELIAMLYILIPLRLGRVVARLDEVFRFVIAAHPWNMMEVLMLGALITLVKLADMATIIPGVALWSFAGLILLFSAVSSSFSVRQFWMWVDQVQHAAH